MVFYQSYNPLGNQFFSTLVAFVPILTLLGLLLFLRLRAHWAALFALGFAIILAIFVFQMPVKMAIASTVYGAVYGFLPIGWIVLNVIFFFRLLNRKSVFTRIQALLMNITPDRRLQLLLVAFCFGALLEGAAGFGTPVAITASLLMGMGFSPLQASGLSLLANTAPVAYGGLGAPIVALQGVTGLDLFALSSSVGRQLTLFGVLIPIWLIWTFAGWKGMREVLPAVLVAGVTFAFTQLAIATLQGPWLVDVIAGMVSMAALILFLRVWKPKTIFRLPKDDQIRSQAGLESPNGSIGATVFPWIILIALVLIWGLPQIKNILESVSLSIEVPFLHLTVFRVPPVLATATAEPAVFRFNWLAATGTAIFLSALISGLKFGFSIKVILTEFIDAFKQAKFSLLTISAMMAVGFVTRYSGMDATLGLAVAKTGVLYPFFGTLLGWLGVALTGSDTSSNVLFGSLQKISAQQLGINPVTMASANSSGGVMGKMVDAQSIVVASTATKWFGHEGDILRFVILHSIALAFLMSLIVFIQVRFF